jgi:hypothetical protein
MRKYKFIHPLTASEYIIQCEKICLCDDYWECMIGEKIYHQFPISYAMINLNEPV